MSTRKEWSNFNGVFSKVFKFNKDRGLLLKGFDYNRESGFLLSEGLELVDNQEVMKALMVDGLTNDEFASEIVKQYPTPNESDLDRQVKYVDTFADQFVFGAGACMKMGLPIGTIIQILHIVMDANLQKTGGTTDDGKQKKGSAFKSPDEQIREILIQNNINMAREK